MTITHSGKDIVVTIGGRAAGSVILQDQARGGSYGVEPSSFRDGTRWSSRTIEAMMIANLVPEGTLLGIALRANALESANGLESWLPNWARKFVDKVKEIAEGDLDMIKDFFKQGYDGIVARWEASKLIAEALVEGFIARVEGYEALLLEMVAEFADIPGLGQYSQDLFNDAHSRGSDAIDKALLALIVACTNTDPDTAQEIINNFTLVRDLMAMTSDDPAEVSRAQSRLGDMLAAVHQTAKLVGSNLQSDFWNKQYNHKFDIGFDGALSGRLMAYGTQSVQGRFQHSDYGYTNWLEIRPICSSCTIKKVRSPSPVSPWSLTPTSTRSASSS